MKQAFLARSALAVTVALLAASAQDRAPRSFEQLVQAAEQAQQQNDLNAAEARYKEALAVHPEIAELHANLGLVNYEQANTRAAYDEFQTALRLKPFLFVPNLFIGIEYLKRNDPSSALRYLTRADRINPQDLEVNLSLGRAYSALNQHPEAISAYLHAVTFHPDSEEGWYGLGTSYLDRAESLSGVLAKRYRDSAPFRALTASYFDEQGKYARSISEYRAIVSNPDAPVCSHSSLGFTLIHNGQPAQAREEFNADFDARNCSAIARIGLARIQMQSGNAPAALDLLHEASKDDPEDFNANAFEFWKDLLPATLQAFQQDLETGQADSNLAELKTTLLRASKGDRPVDFADRVFKNVDNPSQAYLSGHYSTAASLGDKLIAAGALSPNTLYWTVRADQRLGSSALAQAATVAPRSIRIHLLLGDLYRRKGQYLAGQQEFQEALKLEKNNVPALLGLASTYYLNGESASAEAVAKEALSHEPGDIEAKLLLAEILLAERRYEEAYRYVEIVPEGKPDLVAEIHGVRGKIFAATHRPADAILELKKAVDNDEDGDLNYVLARQYQLLGDKQLASAAFRRSNALRQKSHENESYRFEADERN